jgi:hypothetical protein
MSPCNWYKSKIEKLNQLLEDRMKKKEHHKKSMHHEAAKKEPMADKSKHMTKKQLMKHHSKRGK